MSTRKRTLPAVLAVLIVLSVVTPYLTLGVGTASAATQSTADWVPPGATYDDGFEDESADSGTPDGWEYVSDPAAIGDADDGTAAVSTTQALNGSQSFKADTTGGIRDWYRPEQHPLDKPVLSNIHVGLYNSPDGDAEESATSLELYEGTGDVPEIEIRVTDQGGLVYRDSNDQNVQIAQVSQNEWVEVTVTEIFPKENTYNIRWENSTDSGTVRGIEMRSPMEQGYDSAIIRSYDTVSYVDNVWYGGADLAGYVNNQHGEVVPNSTVRVFAMNYSAIPDSENKALESREKIRNLSSPIPSGWKDQQEPDFSLTGGSDSLFKSVDGEYVAVTTSTSSGGIWADSADLSPPKLQVDSDEPVIMTVWDADGASGIGGYVSNLNEYNSQLPGTTKRSGTVVVEQIDKSGGTVSKTTFNLDNEASSAIDVVANSRLKYAEADLSPGYYRIYPEGHQESAYIIQVGSASEIVDAIMPDLTDTSGTVTESASEVRDRLQNGTMTTTTVRTTSEGYYEVNLPENFKTVGVQVYKAGGQLQGTDPTLQDVRNVSLSGYNGSVVVSVAPQVYDTPNLDANVTVHEYSTPPFFPLGDYQNRTEWLQDQLMNLSYSDLPPALQQRLENASREDLESVYSDLRDLREQNDRLNQRIEDILDSREITIDPIENPGEADREDLIKRVQALQQAMTELRDTINSGDPTSSTGDGTMDVTFPFNTDLQPENVAVLVHWSNGTTDTLSTDSDYVTIASGFSGSEVQVRDYPIGEDAASVARFEVKVANQDGIGSAEEQVVNPNYSGAIPRLNAVEMSTLHPGPDETVTFGFHPSGTNFNQLTNVTVYGPSGNTVTSSLTDAKTGKFQTDGKGVYTVRAKFTDQNGKPFTETFRVSAGDTDLDMPASVRAKSSVYGVYAMVGDGLDSGDVEIKNGGGTAVVTAQIASGEDLPGEVHAYTSGVSLNPKTTVKVNVVRGENRQQVSQHVPITLHMKSLPDSAAIYRGGAGGLFSGEPLPNGGEVKYGSVTHQNGSTVIRTFTDDSGTLTISTNSNPGIVDSTIYDVRLTIPDVNLPFVSLGVFPDFGLIPGLPGDGAVPGISVGGLGVAAVYRRKNNA